MKLIRLLLIAFASCLLITSSFAAEPTPEELKKGLDAVTESVDQLTKGQEKIHKKVDSVTDLVTNNTAAIRTLADRLTTTTDAINNALSRQQQILEDISQLGSGGSYVPRIVGNMKDEGFKREFGDAVRESAPTEATLLISNRTDRSEEIVVNGRQHSIISGASREFKVPVGYVTLRLEGEKATRWFVGAPKYTEHIVIASERVETKRVEPLIVDPIKPLPDPLPPIYIYEYDRFPPIYVSPPYISPVYPLVTEIVTPWRAVR